MAVLISPDFVSQNTDDGLSILFRDMTRARMRFRTIRIQMRCVDKPRPDEQE